MRTIIALIFAVITVCRAELSVDTPANVVTCQNTLITWSGGPAGDSYTVQVGISGGHVTTAAVGITTPSFNLFIDLPANTQAFISIIASTGETAQSGVFTIQAGATQTCNNLATLRVLSTIPNPSSVSSTLDPASASTTPAPTKSSGTSSSTSTSSASSRSITATSGLLTSNSNSISLLLPLPLLSLTSTGTSSDPTGVSGPSLGDTSPSSSSLNVGLIAGSTGGGLVALILLLLGICLYRRRRKQSSEVVEQFDPIETKSEETLAFTSSHPAYSRDDLTTPMVGLHPSTESQEPSALTRECLHPELGRITGSAVPLLTPGHNTFVPPSIAPSYNSAISGATPEPFEDPPPMYQDEAEAQIQLQRIQAEEAERARRYDALIANFCALNRDLISPDLERKLHAARYLPEDNPSDVAADYWHTTYDVEFFELRRLQTAYERHVAAQALANSQI